MKDGELVFIAVLLFSEQLEEQLPRWDQQQYLQPTQQQLCAGGKSELQHQIKKLNMKELNLKQLEIIEGGGEVSETILGACAAVGVASALKMIALSPQVAAGAALFCAANGLANYYDWW